MIKKYFFLAVFLGLLYSVPKMISKYVNTFLLNMPPNWFNIPFSFFNRPFFMRQFDILNPLYKSIVEAIFILFSLALIYALVNFFTKRRPGKKDIISELCIATAFTSLLYFAFYNANHYFVYSSYVFDINKISIYIFCIIFTIAYFTAIVSRNRATLITATAGFVLVLLFISTYIRLGVRKVEFLSSLHFAVLIMGSAIIYTAIYKIGSLILTRFNIAWDGICKWCEDPLCSLSKSVRVLLVFTGLAFILFEISYIVFAGGSDTVNTNKNRNVILITMETTRSDHVSAYGYSQNTTPHIDEFFRDKIIFTNCSSTWPATVPSMVSLLSSRYFYYHKTNKEHPIQTNVTFLQEILEDRGYRTAAFVCNWVLEKKNRYIWRGFDIYDDEMPNWYILRNLKERSAAQVNKKVFSWLKNNKDRDFFLWIHYNDPHGPYTPPRTFAKKFGIDKYGQEKNVDISKDFYIVKNEIPKIQQIKGIKDCRYYVSRYDAEINYLDYEINKLLNFLEESRLLDETIIILTADHGEALSGDYGYYFTHEKGPTVDQVDVPLFMHIPGHGPKKITRPVSLISIMPTVLDLLDIKTDYRMDGANMIPNEAIFLRSSSGSRRISREVSAFGIASNKMKDYIFCESDDAYAVKTKKFRLIYDKKDKMLFNRQKDCKETNNVYNDYKTDSDLKRLETLLNNFVNEAKKYNQKPKAERAISKDLEMKLKSLGYL